MTDSQSPTRLWVCVIEREASENIPWRCATSSSMTSGHEQCDWFNGKPSPSMLAGISELANRYDVQANTVAVWTQRHPDFPEPLIQVGGRVRVWWVPEVDEWVKNRS